MVLFKTIIAYGFVKYMTAKDGREKLGILSYTCAAYETV